jgi:taurine transport system permease protein
MTLGCYLLASKGRRRVLIHGLLMVAFMLAVWLVVTHLGLVKPLFLPKPETVLRAFSYAIDGRIDGI